MIKDEARQHLIKGIIPFWKSLKDDENGGFVGYVDYDLNKDYKAEKGCILNSRITWFFSRAYKILGDESLLEYAKHGYDFLMNKCIDKVNGGVYWSISYDGKPLDTTKHTYNQAFSIYALSAYYDATGDTKALETAYELYDLIESKCMDDKGYLEAFTLDFAPESNEKLSENGVMAEKTMNTILHVLEAYTELYRVDKNDRVRKRLEWICDVVEHKIYNPALHRQEVFFDKDYNTLIDLHSFGHDIETSWLMDRTLEILDDKAITDRIAPIDKDLREQTLKVAFDGNSFANECEKGVVNEHRIWWVQAEAVVGFVNGYQKDGKREFMDAALSEWNFIKEHVIDKRCGDWFWEVDKQGKPYEGRPIVEPWKCPYHNGRMCLELITRL